MRGQGAGAAPGARFRLPVDPAFLAFLLGALLQLPIVDHGHVSLDEGQLTAIGKRLVEGEYLYRDVYTGIFPGVYWLTEGLFRVFGVDALVTRYAQLVANALLAAAVFRTTMRMGSATTAWMSWLAVIALVYVSFPALSILAYSTVSLCFTLEAGLAAADYARSGRRRDGIRTGLLLGFATLAKQNYGALALLSVGAGLLWSRKRGPLAQRSLVSAAAPVIGSGACLAASAVVYLSATESLGAFWEATLVTLLGNQLTAFNQPLPPVFGAHPRDGLFLFLYSPGVLFHYLVQGLPGLGGVAFVEVISLAIRVGYGSALLAIAVAPILLWRRLRREPGTEVVDARVLIPLCAVMFFGIFPSAIWSHLAAVLPAQIPLLALIGESLAFAVVGRLLPPVRRVAVRGAAVMLTLVVAGAVARMGYDIRAWTPHSFGLVGASLFVSSRDHHLYGEAMSFLRQCARDDETVFVAPDMPILYVASDRRNPTPYDLVIPGDVRDELLVQKIELAGTRCVVYSTKMYPQFESLPVLFPKLYALLRNAFEVRGAAEYDDARWEFMVRR